MGTSRHHNSLLVSWLTICLREAYTGYTVLVCLELCQALAAIPVPHKDGRVGPGFASSNMLATGRPGNAPQLSIAGGAAQQAQLLPAGAVVDNCKGACWISQDVCMAGRVCHCATAWGRQAYHPVDLQLLHLLTSGVPSGSSKSSTKAEHKG